MSSMQAGLRRSAVAAAVVVMLIVQRQLPGVSRDTLPASLTDAELRVVSWVAGGMTNRSIAEELHVSHHTVDAHLKHVYLKLDIHSRVELTVLAMQQHVSVN